MIRIGHGYDLHQLTEGRALILGGVNIPHKTGLLGHSDADVLVHAIMDSMLGALALGDIGQLFPPDDMQFKDIDSMILLKKVYEIILNKHFKLVNLDATIIAQAPKMLPHIENMRENISAVLNVNKNQISIKATTTEHLGPEGEKKAISAHCVCLLETATICHCSDNLCAQD